MLQVIKYIKYSITCTHTPIRHNIKTTSNIDHLSDTLCWETLDVGGNWHKPFTQTPLQIVKLPQQGTETQKWPLPPPASKIMSASTPHHNSSSQGTARGTQENHLVSKCPRSKTWLSCSELSLEKKKSIPWGAVGKRRFTLSQTMFGCVLQVKEHPHGRQDSGFLSKHCTVATISVSRYMI